MEEIKALGNAFRVLIVFVMLVAFFWYYNAGGRYYEWQQYEQGEE